jgi:O-antigen ligase/tetratricopeptide (TPR) repeat protein
VACVFITPAVFDLGAVKPFDIVKITTVLFFGWLAFGLWLAAVALGRTKPRRFLMGYFAGAYLLVATVATILSPTKATSFIGWYGRHHGWLTILIYVVIFYLVACVYRQRSDRAHELIYAMGAGAVVMTIYILMQRFDIDPISWVRPSGEVPGQRFFGTMGNANFAGGYLALTAPWLYFLFVRFEQTWKRVAIVGWGIVTLYALWLTSARNGILSALPAAIAVIAFVHLRDASRRLRLAAIATALVAALVGVVLAVVIIWHPGSSRAPEVFRRAEIFRSDTIKVRGYWWLAGLKMFAARPVAGWGPDTFVTIYPRYLSPDAAKLGDAETADKPHNVFVEHLAHTGLLGFLAYVGLLFVAFRRAFQRLRIAGRDEKVLLTTLGALLASYVGQAFFSIDVTAIALVGWVTLGLIGAVADPPQRDDEVPPAKRPPSNGRAKLLAGVAIVLACLVAALSTSPLKADHESRTAQRVANADGFIDDVMAHHERSFSYNPLVPQYHGIAGVYLEQQANKSTDAAEKRDLLERSLEQYRENDRIQPGYHVWKMAIGKGIGNLAAVGAASFDDALRWLNEARKLAPYDWRVLANRGDVYNLRATADEEPKDLCLAVADYKAANRMRPFTAQSLTGIGRTQARLGNLDEAIDWLKRAGKFDEQTDLPEKLIEAVQKLKRQKKPPPVISCR